MSGTIESILRAAMDKPVTEISLSHRQMADESCALLAEVIQQSKTITVVDLQDNNITSVGCVAICNALHMNHTVKEVNLESNKIGAEGADAAIQLLRINTSITSFSLAYNDVPQDKVEELRFVASINTQPVGLKNFVNAVQRGESPQSLDVSNSAGSLSLSILKNNTAGTDCLVELHIANCGLGDTGADIVGEIIRDKTTLQVLTLDSNGIGLHGVKNLIEGLKINQSLKTLSLRGNKIGDDAARAITEMLRVNNSLIAIDLSDNAVTEGAMGGILASLQLNEQPIELKQALHAVQADDPRYTAIEFQWIDNISLSAAFLSPYLKLSTQVVSCNLSNSNIGDAGALEIATVVRTNRSIRSLALANNAITDAGAVSLSEALAVNVGVTDLNLANNDLTDVGGQALQQIFGTNNTLVIINLELNSINDELMTEIEGLATVNQQPLALKGVLPAVQENSAELTDIDFSDYDGERYHTDASVAVLCQALRSNSCVRFVDVSNNVINDPGACSFAEVLFTNKTIESLSIMNCSVGDRGATALANVLVENTTLTELLLDGNYIRDEGADALLQMLQVNHFVMTLSLESNRASTEMLNNVKIACAINTQPISLKKVLPQLRSCDPTLTALNFSEFDGHRMYDDEATEILFFEMRDNPNVVSLDLSDNKVGPAGCQAIADFLSQENCNLRELLLMNNDLTEEGVAIIADSLTRNKSLKTMDLRQTGMGHDSCMALAQALKQNDTITSILVSKKDIPAVASAQLARELAINSQTLVLKRVLPDIENNTIQELSFRKATEDRRFDDISCRLIAMALAHNHSVTSLDLSGNEITAAGVEFLSDMLEDNKSILHVDLSDNRINDEGAEMLIKTLQANDTITSMVLTGNPISEGVLAELHYMLRINGGPLALKKQMILVADNNPEVISLEFADGGASPRKFDDEALHILCSLLVDNHNVRLLNLANNNITDVGASLLADLLRINTSIEVLDLSYNPITDEGGVALFKALKGNHTCSELAMEGNAVDEEILEDIDSVLHVNATPLREPKRIRGAKKIEETDDQTTFKDVDYMHDVEDKIYDDSAVGPGTAIPETMVPKTVTGTGKMTAMPQALPPGVSPRRIMAQ